MTTIMLVAAMIPIATGEGPGASARASMAKVILGGQMLSLLLSLLITPVAYSIWDDITNGLGRLFRKKADVVVLTPVPEVDVDTVVDSDGEGMPAVRQENDVLTVPS